MISICTCLTLLAVAATPAVTAAPLGKRHVLWDASGRIPSQWEMGRRAVRESVTFHVALQGANKNVAEELMRVSDPMSPDYGKYLTTEDLRAKFAAPAERQERVESFLSAHGVDCLNIVGSSLKCRAEAAAVEKIFHTKLSIFTHRTSKRVVIRHTGTLSTPQSLASDILFVSGLGQFFHFERKVAKAVGHIGVSTPAPHSSPSTCSGSHGQNCYVVPSTIRTLYNVSEDLASGSAKTSVGVAEFSGNFAISDADLKTFGQQIGSKTSPLAIQQRAGPPNNPGEQLSEEAQLDIQYTSGIGDGVTNWVWNQEHWMYALCTELQNTTAEHRPSVISMSYAWSESAQCGGVTGAECKQLGVNTSTYVARTNEEFAKVGMLGISMLSASGDSGCHGRTEGICLFQKGMKPDYPASSPYVTSVGGTILHSGSVASDPIEPVCRSSGDLAGVCAGTGEEVVSSTGPAGGRISSGGGFASYSPMPDYQKFVVEKYLANTSAMSFAGGKGVLFNAQGRGYPDVSALAHQFYIVMDGETSSVDGTSAASPTIAGLFGLINTRRVKAGKPVLGFANPMLYSIYNATGGAAFNDITSGNNACTEQGCWCKTGFAAAVGWDASTGLGTPNVGNMIAAMAQLDRERDNLTSLSGQRS